MFLRSASIARFLAASLLLPVTVAAQAPAAKEKADPSTLHVYVNLVQIPVLVLDRDLQPGPRVPDRDFHVQLEGYGTLKPARIRLQGQDPLNIVLMVDRSDRDEDLWNNLPKALEPMISSLLPHDRLMVLAMDGCKALRIGSEMVPFNAEWLRQMARNTTAMKAYAAQGRHREPCPRPLRYWDLVAYAANRLAGYPGRKIIVSLGSGDRIDPATSERTHELLNGSSITLFPIFHGNTPEAAAMPYAGSRMLRSGTQAQQMALVTPGVDYDNFLALAEQAERSGGMVLGTSQRGLPKTLKQVIDLVRSRYILEFSRPDNLPAGQHVLLVTDGRPRDFIRPAGITVPLARADEAANPEVEHGAFREDAVPPADTEPAAAPDASTPAPSAPVASAPAAQPAPPPAKPAEKPSAPDPTDITGDLQHVR